MTSFVLKLIAMFSMVTDHVGDAYFKHVTPMSLIGRFAFPIFAFQISEGYIHTKNLKKYFLRLFLFALISQIPFMLFRLTYIPEGDFALNIFFTLLGGLTAISCYDKITKTDFKLFKSNYLNTAIKYIISILPAIFIGILAEVLSFDYGFFGICIIFLFYVFRNNKALMTISFALSCIIKYGLDIFSYGYHYYYVLLCLFTILPIVFILLYNKKQGKKIKYLLYAFYPVHLLIIYLIFGVFGAYF